MTLDVVDDYVELTYLQLKTAVYNKHLFHSNIHLFSLQQKANKYAKSINKTK